MSVIYIPNMARELGASNFEIGVIGASYGVSVFFSAYLFGRASDTMGRRFFLCLGMALCGVTFLLQFFMRDVASMILLRALTGISVGIYTPSLIACVHEKGDCMGKFSSIGSLGWTAGSLIAGIDGKVMHLFILSGMFFITAFIISTRVKVLKVEPITMPLFPGAVVKKNAGVYLPFFLRQTGSSAYYTVLPIFIQDISKDIKSFGLLYSVCFISQVVAMRQLDGIDNRKLLKTGLLASIVVFIATPMMTDYRQAIPMQLLVGLSWSCLYVGSLKHLTENNIEKAASMGMLSSVIHISGAIGPLAAGVVAQYYGFEAVMYFAALMTAAAYLASRFIDRGENVARLSSSESDSITDGAATTVTPP
jgi:MFS family permease